MNGINGKKEKKDERTAFSKQNVDVYGEEIDTDPLIREGKKEMWMIFFH